MSFFSSPQSKSAGELMGETAGAVQKNYPQMYQMLQDYINKSYMPNALAQYQAEAAISPMYQQTINDMYKQYAPELANIGAGIGEQLQQRQTAANLAAMQGTGKDAVAAATALDRQANPEFYATRESEAKRLGDLMGSIDLSGALSGSENRALGQSIAQQGVRTGTLNAPSAINAAQNAMQYGEKTYQRQEQAKNDLAAALNQATGFLPASQSQIGGMNAYNIATGGGGNMIGQLGAGALGNFAGIQQGAGATGASGAGNLFSNMLGQSGNFASQANQINSSKPSGFANLMGNINLGLNTAQNLSKTLGSQSSGFGANTFGSAVGLGV